MKELVFYRCNICGNIICMVSNSGMIPSCCGEKMELITPNTVDASKEKHLPVIHRCGTEIKICVGSAAHPMTKDHYISRIILQTNRGTYAKRLLPENLPEACFCIREDEYPIRVYCCCNLHGLWMTAAGEQK